MKKLINIPLLLITLIVTPFAIQSAYSDEASSDDIFRLRMFFGLSLPSGGGVSLADWQDFEENKLAKEFTGFNVVDSVGYYEGKPERSKVVTLIVTEEEIAKAEKVAQFYAKKFKQDSVMIVKVPAEWSFIGAGD